MRTIIAGLLLLISLGLHTTADASSCTLAHTGEAIPYWSKTNPVANSTRCDWNGSAPTCRWYGWLWKGPAQNSASTGNLPLVIHIHGSGRDKSRNSICEIVNYLVPKGYVVFMPYMRGVDDDSTYGTGNGFKNTGMYIEDYASQGGATGDQYVLNTLSYMEWMAADEVQFALDKMTGMMSGDGSKKLINPNKIALWGHSYGGAVVNIATGITMSPQPAATIDLGGAVMSWPFNSNWELVLDSYSSQAKNPIYFQQVLNESSATPTWSMDSVTSRFRKASAALVGAQMNVFAQIAPDADTQTNCNTNGTPQYQCVHNAFIMDHDAVQHWIGSAVEFMARHGVK